MSTPADIWTALAAPIEKGKIDWRADGKPFQKDGRPFGRYVAYIDGGTVRERLDAVVPGEWTLELTHLPSAHDADGVAIAAFKAWLTIKGIAREDVGTGRDVKAAATDSMKRAAARFGVGAELHGMSAYVELDRDGKGARPIENPQAAYERRHQTATTAPAATPARSVRPPAPPMIDPRIPRGAPAPSRAASQHVPPHHDHDRLF